MDHQLTLIFVLVLTLGLAAQWLSWRLRLPAIVLLIAAGLLAGPVLGILRPSEEFGPLLGPAVKLCVAVILFEGGLSLRIWELKEAATGVWRLVFPGVLFGWSLGSLAAHFVGGLSWPVALVLGAILVVTGPTVIIPLLRHARLRRRPASFLKWEGIVNDPIGALLAVLVFEYFAHTGPGGPLTGILVGVVLTIATAAALGAGGGWLVAQALRHGHVPEYLKGPLILGTAIVVYALADLAQDEAGLAAATVLGVVIGNQRLADIHELRRFKEYVVVLLVSAVFILLTADIDPLPLRSLVTPRTVLLILTLLFVVRPATVLLSTMRADMEWGERLLVAWIAPRGIVAAAVAAAFAQPLQTMGYAGADLLVPLVFLLVLVTVTVHGLSISVLARRLGLASANPHGILIVGGSPWSADLARTLSEMQILVLLADSSWSALRQARLGGLPVHYGEILSEASEESLELNQIGYLLAATGNDAYNALVCTRFGAELGRDRVFQLPLEATQEKDPRGLSLAHRGRVVFEEGVGLEELLARYYRGWGFKKTRITDTFTSKDLGLRLENGTMRLLMVRENGEVEFEVPSDPLEPGPGDTVVTYGPREKGAASA